MDVEKWKDTSRRLIMLLQASFSKPFVFMSLSIKRSEKLHSVINSKINLIRISWNPIYTTKFTIISTSQEKRQNEHIQYIPGFNYVQFLSYSLYQKIILMIVQIGQGQGFSCELVQEYICLVFSLVLYWKI